MGFSLDDSCPMQVNRQPSMEREFCTKGYANYIAMKGARWWVFYPKEQCFMSYLNTGNECNYFQNRRFCLNTEDKF